MNTLSGDGRTTRKPTMTQNECAARLAGLGPGFRNSESAQAVSEAGVFLPPIVTPIVAFIDMKIGREPVSPCPTTCPAIALSPEPTDRGQVWGVTDAGIASHDAEIQRIACHGES